MDSEIRVERLEGMLGYQLRRAYQSYYQGFNKVITEKGITSSHLGVLYVVLNNPGRMQNAVADALGHDRTFLVAVVSELIRKGFLVAEKSIRDRRSKELYITQTGKEFLDQTLISVRAYEKRFRERFTQDEKEQFLEFLSRMY